MRRAIRKVVECPWKKEFINWDTCAFHCNYSGSYNEFFGYINCNYRKNKKGIAL